MMLELLLQLSWQGAAVAVLVLILRALFGRYLSARWRHALWLLVLGRLLIPALPQSHASLFMLGNLIRRDVPTDTMPMVHFPSQPQMWRVSVIDNSIPSGSPKAAKLTEPWWHRSGVIQLVWMSIAAVLLLRLVISNWIFNRQLKQHPKTNSQHIQRLFDACRNELRVTRHCELQISDAVSAPATYGIFRPCVLLPECMASSQKESDLRLIFLHELSHIKCHDVVLEWLWAVLQCVHWFNPILWAMAPLRKMDREQARDEMVLTLAGADQSVAYGQILLNLASDSASNRICPGLVGILSGNRSLKRRIKMICNYQNSNGRRTAISVAILLVAGCCALTNPTIAQTPGPTTVSTTRLVAVMKPGVAKYLAAQTALEKKIDDIRMDNLPFGYAIDKLSKEGGVTMTADWAALQMTGVTRATPVTCRLHGIKLSKALELVFDCVQGDQPGDKLIYTIAGDEQQAGIFISTGREIDNRTYFVNDLMFVPQDYDLAPHTAAKEDQAATRAMRMADLKTYIENNVDPSSWVDHGGKIGSMQVDAQKTLLSITQTHANQVEIEQKLDALRKTGSVQISLETRLITMDDGDLQSMPENIRRHFTELTGAGKSRTDQILSAEEVHQLLEWIQNRASVSSLTAPRLTMFDKQKAALVVDTQQAYVDSLAEVQKTVDGKSVTAFEPHTATTTATGVTIGDTVCASPDLTSVFVESKVELARLLALVPETRTSKSGVQGTFQHPESVVYKRSVTCAIPNSNWMLIGGFSQDISIPVIDHATTLLSDLPRIPEGDQEKGRQIFMLLKPTILKK